MGNQTQVPLTRHQVPATLPLTEVHPHPDGASHVLHIPQEGLTDDSMEPRRRCSCVWAAVVVAILLALGFGFLAGSLGGLNQHEPTESSQHEPTEMKQLSHKKTDSWEDNARELVALGCRPVKTKVAVKELLKKTDSTMDLSIYPTHLAVLRCVDEHAFCGNDRMGEVKGRCVPKANHTEHFAVMQGGQRSASTVECEVHDECYCDGTASVDDTGAQDSDRAERGRGDES